jgi:DNA-directed RNA polymerase sigma subunit (sigma70/sigma32)
MGETCALDIAERGGITLEEVGEIMNLTRERIRQLEMSGLTKLSEIDAFNGVGLNEFSDFAWND